ncbi:MAG: DNA mismatch repair protein MutT [Verrucomicrobiales bacterium]|nr:DNA mismatch repair protein MutT [Verrucomicrobiales bacterium]
MRKLKSCGVILFRREPSLSFLLMCHRNRYDLPKGHLEEGETEEECALRELREETGIRRDKVELDSDFRYVSTYQTRYRRFNNEMVEKSVVVFLGWLIGDAEVTPSEHQGYEWFDLHPLRPFDAPTIEEVLKEVSKKVFA